jgi:D-alanyl-D-alanine carboxypeptidase
VYRGPDAAALAIVTKTQGLSPDYAPTDLVSLNDLGIPTYNNDPEQLRFQAAMDLAEMFALAQREGIHLLVRSAYRSYAVQAATYAQFVEEEMRAAEQAGQPITRQEAETRANRYSARPGYSQHQLGTTVDITSADATDLVPDFGRTPAGRWLHDNAHKFGFVFSYPEGKERLTGYIYEPWHLRWIGRGHAEMLHALDYLNPESPMTLDVYLQGLQ